MVGIERLGQQLFFAPGFAQSWFWRAAVRRLRVGAGRGFGNRYSQSGHVRLGNDQFPQDGAGAGRWPAICEKLAREAAATD